MRRLSGPPPNVAGAQASQADGGRATGVGAGAARRG